MKQPDQYTYKLAGAMAQLQKQGGFGTALSIEGSAESGMGKPGVEETGNSYGVPMDSLWTPYGLPMEQHAHHTLATRQQQAKNWLHGAGCPRHYCDYAEPRQNVRKE